MKKTLIIVHIVFFAITSYSQTIEQKAKAFLVKFEKMDDSQKRAASNVLVMELNSMDPSTRGRWLVALGFGENNKKVEIKKDYPKPWTTQEVEAEVIKQVKYELTDNESTIDMGLNKSNLNVLDIKILKKVSNKQWATLYNNKLQKEIDSIEKLVNDEKAERTKLKEKFPEGYAQTYSPRDEWDDNGKKIIDTLKPYYKRFLYLTDNLKSNIRRLPEMKESFLKGIIDGKNWDDEVITHFLVETILQEKDELDDARIHSIMIADYKSYDFSRDNFEQYIHAYPVEYEIAEKKFYSYEQ